MTDIVAVAKNAFGISIGMTTDANFFKVTSNADTFGR